MLVAWIHASGTKNKGKWFMEKLESYMQFFSFHQNRQTKFEHKTAVKSKERSKRETEKKEEKNKLRNKRKKMNE